ncbi:hypothetical protein EV363DRAFT_1409768 [Boletus edulis]|nr:hypothetical protein EV363DRAFT_1409768 [Boletus edulis]
MDWNMQFEISHEHMPPARGKEELSKATKDLMSLDGDKWRYPLGPCSPSETSVTPGHKQQQMQANPLTLVMPSSRIRYLHISVHRPRTHSFPFTTEVARIRYHTTTTPWHHPRRLRGTHHRSDPHPLMQNCQISDIVLLLPRTTPMSCNYRLRAKKKANHIQSEQKRRANIRRGYDALCETVPALREACQAEDEQLFADGKPRNRRRGKGKAKIDDGEKVDGRAGPRSENVVLSKSIDYLHELLSEREALMQRHQAARSALPADHPLLHPPPDAPLPLWERKWTGGEQNDEDDEDD